MHSCHWARLTRAIGRNHSHQVTDNPIIMTTLTSPNQEHARRSNGFLPVGKWRRLWQSSVSDRRPSGPRRKSLTVMMVATIAACACVLPVCVNFSHRVFFNPSSSAPRGWYWLSHARSYELGSFTISHLPAPFAALADHRRYIPQSIPVLKRIAAAPGDWVCESVGDVVINGRFVARAVTVDGSGRELKTWQGCSILASGQYFLLNADSTESFDSRYFGPVKGSMFVGTAIPLWIW